ncbi:Na+/H+ antiporter subunit E [Lentisphaera profundi]|uniref:Na+/H+ antiporter subunit E n=1 Tax=Lentisphaera profundi TaxID=1658616 RepID=A0ABY7VP44_9BACT|nr:Na+/H+ antiporter subunit E [Lentisphaera profundi]WDE95452.1 Na+/H+ antiporter subunit E [Lentisphaera profundi]
MKIIKLFSFALFYMKEVVISNFMVAYDVLTKKHHMTPGFVAIPIPDLTDRQLLVLSNLLTMTPGSITIDLSLDKQTLYIHAMYIDNVEDVRTEIIEKYVNRVREAF